MSLAMDDEVMGWFREKVNRAGGGNYQVLINDVLREHIRQERGRTSSSDGGAEP